MNIKYDNNLYDVIVVGGGFAALQAAVSAAEKGHTVLICTKVLFGGSSFYPNTWGLGTVGADGTEDIDNFIETIMNVGCNINDRKLVSTLVNKQMETLNYMKQLGLPLLHSQNKKQREFIPCFDHKNRSWHGLQSEPLKKAYSELLEKYNIKVNLNEYLIDLIVENNEVHGIISSDKKNVHIYKGKSVILATGGLGNLYEKSLNTSDVTGVSQYLAMKHGSSLINLEFQQMMFGYSDIAYKTIYNEKVFRYTNFISNNEFLFDHKESKYLELRSEHGPFTAQRESRYIDLKIIKEINKGNKVYGQYSEDLFTTDSEFIKTYFDWMKNTKKLDIKAPFEINMFYHAANGGITINENAKTSLENLYACGEVSGGIHGADRIGGLTTASSLTFGTIAGEQVNKHSLNDSKNIVIDYDFDCYEDASEMIKRIQKMMQSNVLVIRNENGLLMTQKELLEIKRKLRKSETRNAKTIVESTQLLACLNVSLAIVQAALLRKESRGSHYRQDYENTDKVYEKRIVSTMNDDVVITEWEM